MRINNILLPLNKVKSIATSNVVEVITPVILTTTLSNSFISE